jgi:hypothetical protein
MLNLADEDCVPGKSSSIGDAATSGSFNQKDDAVSFYLESPGCEKLNVLSKFIGQKES